MIVVCTLAVKIPDEVFLNLHKTQAELALHMKQVYAAELYKERKVSLGYAAAWAEMHKEDFIHFLATFDISIFSFESEDEFKEEIDNA